MCEDLGPLQAELANRLAVRLGLGRRGGGGELDVLDAKFVEPGMEVRKRAWERCSSKENYHTEYREDRKESYGTQTEVEVWIHKGMTLTT